MDSPTQHVVVRRFLLAALGLPALLTAAGVALHLWALPDLPDPMAIHWGPDGKPDGFGGPTSSLILTVAVGLGLPAVFTASLLPALRRGDRGPSYRFLAATMAATSALVVTVSTWTTVMQRGVADARDTGSVWWALADGVLNAVVIGFLAWRIQPHQTASPSTSTVEPLTMSADERIVWLQETTMPRRWALVATVGTAVGTVAAIASWFTADRSLAVVLTVSALVLVVALLTTTAFRVRVDDRGLTVTSWVGLPRFHVPLGDLTDVEVIDVHGLGDYGGYGIRWLPGRIGIIVHRGPALQVTRRSGRRLAVTVEDATTGASALAALLRRSA
ncbi:MAG TPA: DUF1648 domain-containing protein [Aeromicrobium sp.]|nr:DUF1648 domain-containing protein [Aeromicrobium sp.]